jgi:hypothetical protein
MQSLSPYEIGYREGKAGKHPDPIITTQDEYMLGWEDGAADYANIRPVDDLYYKANEAPSGFEWTGEKRTPEPGDYYLSKNGNAILCEKVRGNNQKRHILKRM